ncbi:MAG: isoprenylcysteine carboxylmethyltransferase family protein [Rhizomicrobium sp.]|jgi:protein-S-isoprenylcysteine O-methyltransferase Ste14
MTDWQTFRTTKLYDILAALPLILLYGLGVKTRLLPDLLADIGRIPAARAWLDIARDASTIVYFALIIALVVFRRVPVERSAGLLPRVIAFVSVAMAIARPKYLALEHLPAFVEAFTVILTVCGTIASIVVLIWLGRGFSIMPEARTLVTDGPYRIVRHPLYIAEEIGNIGIMLQYTQPWSLLLEVINVSLQLWRMSFEERVLTQAFPGYSDYAARTSRIIPGIY